MARFLPLSALLVLTSGCVERMLSIRSEPAGASVFVDGQEVGKTPCEVPFVWYGGREIALHREGCQTERNLVSVSAPWWQYPVFDFLTDVLCPFRITDRREFFYALRTTEVQPAEIDEVKKRAEELRKKANERPP